MYNHREAEYVSIASYPTIFLTTLIVTLPINSLA